MPAEPKARSGLPGLMPDEPTDPQKPYVAPGGLAP